MDCPHDIYGFTFTAQARSWACLAHFSSVATKLSIQRAHFACQVATVSTKNTIHVLTTPILCQGPSTLRSAVCASLDISRQAQAAALAAEQGTIVQITLRKTYAVLDTTAL